MKNLIKKILRESEWDWVKEVNPFQPGRYFTEEDICFNDYGCEVNINGDEILFKIEWEDWADYCDVVDDNRWYIEPLLYHGTDYEGGDDWYEFDDDEFNYSGYQMSDEQAERFQEILNITTNGEEKIVDFRDDTMLSIKDELKYPPLKDYFDTLVSDYLNEIGYAIQRNRWIMLGNEFESKLKITGSEWELYSNTLEITVPMNIVWEWYSKGIDNMSDLLLKVSEPISDIYWYDWFHDEWDISGAEVGQIFDRFLENAEEFLEDTDEFKKWEEFMKLIDTLKFKRLDRWSNKSYIRDNPNNTKWIMFINQHDETADLELYNKGDNRYSTKPLRKFKVPLDQIATYVNNYSLKLESTK